MNITPVSKVGYRDYMKMSVSVCANVVLYSNLVMVATHSLVYLLSYKLSLRKIKIVYISNSAGLFYKDSDF